MNELEAKTYVTNMKSVTTSDKICKTDCIYNKKNN